MASERSRETDRDAGVLVPAPASGRETADGTLSGETARAGEIPGSRRYRTRGNGSRRYDLFVPVPGWLEAGLWLSFCYFVAGPLTEPAVTAVLRWEPGLSPDSVRTALAVFLWLLTGAVVLTHVGRQLSGNPRTFETADERLSWVDSRRPTLAGHLFYATAVLAGTLVVAALWPSAGRLLDDVFTGVLARQPDVAVSPVAVSPTSVVLLGCALVGFAVSARSLDRLVTGLVYESLARSLRAVDGLAQVDPTSAAAREADRVVGWFAIGAAVALVGYWVVALAVTPGSTALNPGGPSTTVLGAVVTATLLLVAGTALVADRPYGERTFLVAAGLLTYAAVDTATLLAERGDAAGVAVFVALAALSLAVVTLVLTNGSRHRASKRLGEIDLQ